jgi:hypothetical protein
MGPPTLDGIGWTFPLGAALIVVGLVLLALVDAPRRLLWRIRRFRDESQRLASGSRPDDGPISHDPGPWVSPHPEPTSHAEVVNGGPDGEVQHERPLREAADLGEAADLDGATTSDPGGTPGTHQEPVEPGLDPASPPERPSEQVD